MDQRRIREAERKKRKKRKARFCDVVFIIFLILIILTMAGIGAGYYYLHDAKQVKGVYSRKIDLTEQVIDNINRYLSEALFGNEIDAREFVDEVNLEVKLAIGNDYSFREELKEESYEEVSRAAREALKVSLQKLLARRLDVAALDSEMNIDELVQEALGMSLDRYLDEYGPMLLPEKEKLTAEYHREGSYTANRNSITLTLTDGTVVEYAYLVSDKMLVLSGEYETVYTREAEQ